MLTLVKTMRVLVVDDERAVCRSVEKILMRQGHTVEKTQTVADAIRALEANPAFDVILADLMMPQASGLDLLRMAHDRWPAIPVIIMTGYASIASAIEATRAGAIGYLPKPFTPDELEAAIERTFIVMTPHASAKPVAKAAAKPTPVPAQHANDIIDVDMPFSFAQVAAATSEAYADALGRGDMAVTGRWNPNKSTGQKVLVVDDEPVVASSMRRSLNRRGFRVDEAFSGNDALNRILNEMYDLVLLDMRMPDSSGLELLPTIKKHRPKLPVVMVTGYASIDTAVEAIQRGASDYMAKPFTPDELYAAATRAIRSAGPA